MLPHDDRGSGPAVVLLHAGIADRTMWAEHLGPLAEAGHRAIAVDLPGFGEAPPRPDQPEWEAVLETMEELSVERAALAGNSFGGAVAMRAAVLAPERVVSLALISAPPPVLEPSAELAAVWEAEEAALERGDIEGAVEAVLDAWLLPDAPEELRQRVGRMQRRALELQAGAAAAGAARSAGGAAGDARGARGAHPGRGRASTISATSAPGPKRWPRRSPARASSRSRAPATWPRWSSRTPSAPSSSTSWVPIDPIGVPSRKVHMAGIHERRTM